MKAVLDGQEFTFRKFLRESMIPVLIEKGFPGMMDEIQRATREMESIAQQGKESPGQLQQRIYIGRIRESDRLAKA